MRGNASFPKTESLPRAKNQSMPGGRPPRLSPIAARFSYRPWLTSRRLRSYSSHSSCSSCLVAPTTDVRFATSGRCSMSPSRSTVAWPCHAPIALRERCRGGAATIPRPASRAGFTSVAWNATDRRFAAGSRPGTTRGDGHLRCPLFFGRFALFLSPLSRSGSRRTPASPRSGKARSARSCSGPQADTSAWPAPTP